MASPPKDQQDILTKLLIKEITPIWPNLIKIEFTKDYNYNKMVRRQRFFNDDDF